MRFPQIWIGLTSETLTLVMARALNNYGSNFSGHGFLACVLCTCWTHSCVLNDQNVENFQHTSVCATNVWCVRYAYASRLMPSASKNANHCTYTSSRGTIYSSTVTTTVHVLALPWRYSSSARETTLSHSDSLRTCCNPHNWRYFLYCNCINLANINCNGAHR